MGITLCPGDIRILSGMRDVMELAQVDLTLFHSFPITPQNFVDGLEVVVSSGTESQILADSSQDF